MSGPVAGAPGVPAGPRALMTPRLLAVATLVLGAAALYTFLVLLGFAPGAPEPLRVLRAGKQRTVPPASLAPFTPADFVALPHGAPAAEVAALESRGVTLEGWTQRTLWAGDGDVHLEIVNAPRGPESPDTAYVTAEVTPAFRRGSERWSYEGLVAALRPNHGGATAWDSGPRRVRLSGWLLYDWQYDNPPGPHSLAHGAPRLTGWEIHPVTRIQLWDDSTLAWQEWPR